MCKIFCNSSEDLETRNQQAHDQHNEDTCYGWYGKFSGKGTEDLFDFHHFQEGLLNLPKSA